MIIVRETYMYIGESGHSETAMLTKHVKLSTYDLIHFLSYSKKIIILERHRFVQRNRINFPYTCISPQRS